MVDSRIVKLARGIVEYSVSLKPGEKVLIEAFDTPYEMVVELVKAVYKAGGQPFVTYMDTRIRRSIFNGASLDQIKFESEFDLNFMKEMQAYITIRGSHNSLEYCDIDSEQMKMITKTQRPVVNQRVNFTKWSLLRWPTPSMAQSANMSTEAFENFYFDVCTLDYSKMKAASANLVAYMQKTDKVRIVGPGETDITFSIKNIPAIACSGEFNIPDGEVFTAPVIDSVNGVIHYNTPTIYNGKKFENIKLVFKSGKIVEAYAANQSELDSILDSDVGSRFVGEFAIGFNPKVLDPMCDILFDEKIAGSIHFTPGQAYTEADNGNRSDIHWDLVLIQREEYGGGEIYFDDVLIRKNGIFVVDELKCLNPENLEG